MMMVMICGRNNVSYEVMPLHLDEGQVILSQAK